MDGRGENLDQNISNDTENVGLRIVLEHISSASFHNSYERLKEANPAIIEEWVRTWTPRLKSLSASDLAPMSAIQAQQHNPQQIVVDVFAWLSDFSSPHQIMWIHHEDRSQTSFLAQAIANILEEFGKLSGSFFSSKPDSRTDINRIIPTLAFQLAQYIPDTGPLIARTARRDLSIFDLQAKPQLKRLIIDPLSFALKSGKMETGGIPNVFLIHGLDEFDNAYHSQLSFLYAFSNALTLLATENIPCRLVLVGQVSSNIKKCMSKPDLQQRVFDRPITTQAPLEEHGGLKKRRVGDPWRLMNTLKGHTGSVVAVAFSADGTKLTSGSHDKTVRIWDAKTGSLVVSLEGHSDIVHDIAFSADGKIASGSSDKTVRLWDVETRSIISTLEGHSSGVRSVAFSPNGSRLASGSEDNQVRLWDVRTGSLVASLAGHTGSVWDVEFSVDGLRLASGSLDYTVRLWEGGGTGNLITTLKGHSNQVQSVMFSPDGSRLASGSHDNTVGLWEGKTGSLVATLQGHSSPIHSATFSPDSSKLASGSNDNTVRLWEGKTGGLITTLQGHSSAVQCVAFSPDGSILASGSFDKTVRLWDVKTGNVIATLDGYSAWLHSIAFSPDGSSIAFASAEYTVQIWS